MVSEAFPKKILDTLEIRSLSLLVPTISFNLLASLISPSEALIGSIKRVTGLGLMLHTSSKLTSTENPPIKKVQ